MKIQNVSLEEVKTGDHIDFGQNTLLIQITDPAKEPPIPMKDFNSVFHFEFLDADLDDLKKNPSYEEFLITEDQAKSIVNILNHALEKELNVIVHCHAGICRSGAVVEVAEMMGFEKSTRFRAPNLLVKHQLMKVLGWTYDSEEKPYLVNSTINEEVDNAARSNFGLPAVFK